MMMQQQSVPFFSLKKQTDSLHNSIETSLAKLITTQQFIGGQPVEAFESALANYLQVNHTIACNSGTDALWLALKALSLPCDAIVLTTPFSFIASSSEIVAHKAHPVFIDIDHTTLNLSPAKLEEWLCQHTTIEQGKTIHTKTGKLVAGIVTVDLFGQCADYQAIKDIAKKYHLWIVEDACQAIGSQLEDGKKAGSLGDIAAFSFYPTKNLGAFGDAGACATNNPHLAERLRQLRNHGRKTHYEYEELGINSRMDSIQATVLTEKLTYLDSFNQKRRLLAQRYQHHLKTVSSIILPNEIIGTHVFHQYSIRVTDCSIRDALIKYLDHHNIGTRVFYPQLLSSIPFLQTDKQLTTVCPVAQRTIETIICLPIWPELELSDIDYVCHHINDFMTKINQLTQQPTTPAAHAL